MGAWLGWTEENKAEARRLFLDEGRSAAEICIALNAASRSAVIGILHRMGAKRGAQATSVTKALSARQRAAAPRRVAPRASSSSRPRPPPEPSVPPPTGGKSLVELRATDCRYPVSGAGADTRYCGGFAVDPLHPWCREHEAVVYARSAA